jgi:membrane associated rhomboid family serine protease|tara:strand:- start:17981 stop:18808 length:828 start_codon:yes stop_codon:yes gene_type:complete
MELKNKIKNYYINSNSVQKIIIINILIFIFPLLIKTILHLFNLNDIDIVSFFTIESDLLKIIFKPWSVLTYGFFHSGFYHLFWNMLMLYYFGNRLQNLFGDKLFYNIFFNGIIFGALLYVFSYNVFPVFKGNESQMIGASAGVMAVLFYLSSYNPNLRIRLFIVEVKLIYIALFLLILDIIQIPNGNSGGHIAHIGGALTGYCLLKYNYQGLNLPSILSFFNSNKNIKKTNIKFDKIDQKKIDIILDKISESGYDSLSKDEKNYLFKAGNKNDKN